MNATLANLQSKWESRYECENCTNEILFIPCHEDNNYLTIRIRSCPCFQISIHQRHPSMKSLRRRRPNPLQQSRLQRQRRTHTPIIRLARTQRQSAPTHPRDAQALLLRRSQHQLARSRIERRSNNIEILRARSTRWEKLDRPAFRADESGVHFRAVGVAVRACEG